MAKSRWAVVGGRLFELAVFLCVVPACWAGQLLLRIIRASLSPLSPSIALPSVLLSLGMGAGVACAFRSVYRGVRSRTLMGGFFGREIPCVLRRAIQAWLWSLAAMDGAWLVEAAFAGVYGEYFYIAFMFWGLVGVGSAGVQEGPEGDKRAACLWPSGCSRLPGANRGRSDTLWPFLTIVVSCILNAAILVVGMTLLGWAVFLGAFMLTGASDTTLSAFSFVAVQLGAVLGVAVWGAWYYFRLRYCRRPSGELSAVFCFLLIVQALFLSALILGKWVAPSVSFAYLAGVLACYIGDSWGQSLNDRYASDG